MAPLKCLEFYSGIGGMAAALKAVCPECSVLAAFDINELANRTYAHNFGQEPLQVLRCCCSSCSD